MMEMSTHGNYGVKINDGHRHWLARARWTQQTHQFFLLIYISLSQIIK
jgi:hypothetical protein